jgi:hypothetical protein
MDANLQLGKMKAQGFNVVIPKVANRQNFIRNELILAYHDFERMFLQLTLLDNPSR